MPGVQAHMRSFYRRYQLLTFVLPAFASAAAIFSVQLLSLRYTFDQDRSLYFFWGTVLLVVGALAMPFFMSLGFKLSGLARLARSPSPDEQARLKPALEPRGSLNQEFQTRVLDLGDVPFLAAGGQRPVCLWISSAVLERASAEDLPYLIAHEKAHLAARGWFDDAFAYWAFFMMVAVTLSAPFPLPAKLLLMTLSRPTSSPPKAWAGRNTPSRSAAFWRTTSPSRAPAGCAASAWPAWAIAPRR
jgi:hypothetical protein